MTDKVRKQDARQLKKFGWLVGGTLLAVAGILLWRGRGSAALVFCTLGAVMLLAAFLRPSALDLPHRAWMKLARGLGWLNTRLLLVVVFYLVLTPLGLAMRLLGKRPLELGRDKQAESYWIPRKKEPFDPKRYEKHF